MIQKFYEYQYKKYAKNNNITYYIIIYGIKRRIN